ncbi:DUF1566 domain-containing protein [Pseudoalteromonas fenneropenaei]|uniref:DUF1566 domain-containing protein n=1 Tax=Pseudoalteromonas fenneropenaei TaxID=1737459 RepID=A0ABV7CEW5_9GAMM
MRRQNKTVVAVKHWLLTLTLAVSFASGSVYADNWEQLKASGDLQKLQEYIRQNPASDHLVDAAALAYSKLLQQDNVSALLLFNEEFKDLVALPAFKAKSAAQSGLDTRFTFREGKIGERYVPVLNHSSSSTNTRYINGRAITETTYNDYTTGGYSQDRYGFTAVYQLFNESNNNYIVDLTLSGTVTMTELNRQVAGVWSDEHHTTNVKQTKLEQQSSYLLKKGENVRDQLVVGEKQPADFKITISGITPVSDNWIEELQQILEADEDIASTTETEEETGVLQTIKGFWKSATELPSMLSSKPEPLMQIEQYLADPRAVKWSDILKQRYTETALKQLDIRLDPEARYDRDFDSLVKVLVTNNASVDLSIEYTTNFGAKGRTTLKQGQRNELNLRGKGVDKESLSFSVISATNANPNKTTAVTANITPAQLEAFKQRIAERDEEATYKLAKNIQTLNAYLKKYPKGKYSKLAPERLESIYFASNDLSVMYRYLSDYPKSSRYSEMQKKINATLEQQGFRDNFDGTITQLSAKLQWMRCFIGEIWDGQKCSGSPKSFNFENASKLKHDFAGYSDWRLPEIGEIFSLVNCSSGSIGKNTRTIKEGAAAIKTGCLGNFTKPASYSGFPLYGDTWSSTIARHASYSFYIWYVDFNDGDVYTIRNVSLSGSMMKVLMVRPTEEKRKADEKAAKIAAEKKKIAAEEAAKKKKIQDEKARLAAEEKGRKELLEAGYIDNGDGTVTALATKLVWRRCSEGQSWTGMSCSGEATRFSWNDAMKLTKEGWRLPTLEELDSLVFCSSGQRKPTPRPNGKYDRAKDGECTGKFSEPAINQLPFPITFDIYSMFWSSSKYYYGFRGREQSWAILFAKGYWNYEHLNENHHVRLVRTAASKDLDSSKTSQSTSNHTNPIATVTETALPFSAGQTWVGNYRCAQGSTPLRLIIDSVNGSEVNAKFDFTSRGVNGIYQLNGIYNNNSRKITFATGNWVKRASGFSAVGMDGTVSKDGKTFSGDITDRGCSTFQVSLQ